MEKKIRKLLAMCLVGMLLALPVHAASSFPDVAEDADYAEAAEYLSEIGIMVGDDQGNFNPDKAVSRAEMATIICRMLGETEDLTTGSDFTDVPESHWANKYITKAAELGIVGGYGDGKFGPGDAVKFEQAIKMVVCAVNLAEQAVLAGGYPQGYIEVANEYGYTTGIDVAVGDPLSRGNVAMLLHNILVF